MTQRMASTMFDFPQPFGPTMAVMGSWKLIEVFSTKDLKPTISTRLILIVSLLPGRPDALGAQPESRDGAATWHQDRLRSMPKRVFHDHT